MKHLFLFAVSAAIAACNLTESKEASKDKEAYENDARKAVKDSASFTTIQWLDKEIQDLGTIKKGDVVEITWKFKNSGNKPLFITDVRAGCGCTTPDVPKEPIAPGATSVIRAKFNSENFSGHVTKDVYVDANNSNRNNSTDNKLTFTAEIKE